MRRLGDTPEFRRIRDAASVCAECGGVLGEGNVSGLCRRHNMDRARKLALEKRKEGRIEKVCPICGDSFATFRSQAMRRKYCSYECRDAGESERIRATYPPKEEVRRLYEDERLNDRELGRRFGRSYNWALKVRQHYGIKGRPKNERTKPPRSDRARWAISLKPEPACRNCGAEGKLLALHHAVPRSLSPAGKYDLRNGVPLCTSCHLGWHARRVPLHRDIFTPEEWSFIETLIGPGWLERRYPVREKAAA